MTSDRTVRFFVYGTLKPGGRFYRRIERFVRGLARGTVRGVLVDAGGYPALLAGEGIVEGFVLEVDEAAFAITDRIEAYDPATDTGMYLRREVEVRGGDGAGEPLIAWTYVYGDGQRLAGRPLCRVGECEGVAVFSWGKEARSEK